jgi:hypothetical protein
MGNRDAPVFMRFLFIVDTSRSFAIAIRSSLCKMRFIAGRLNHGCVPILAQEMHNCMGVPVF